MQKLQLYISGERIDLFKDEQVSISLSQQDVKDPAKIFAEFTKTFTIPASKRNNKIFTHLFDVTRIQDAFSFNPYIKTQCILKQDGYDIFQGYLQLIEITNQDGEINYNVNLYSEPLVLVEVLQNRKFINGYQGVKIDKLKS